MKQRNQPGQPEDRAPQNPHDERSRAGPGEPVNFGDQRQSPAGEQKGDDYAKGARPEDDPNSDQRGNDRNVSGPNECDANAEPAPEQNRDYVQAQHAGSPSRYGRDVKSQSPAGGAIGRNDTDSNDASRNDTDSDEPPPAADKP